MKKTVYLDNAATTYPKPQTVSRAVSSAIANLGGNPGRGGHSYSLSAAEVIYSARAELSDFFKSSPENVVFTLNCTHSLNLAINGICKAGDRVVISSMEHNSVARPCYKLALDGADVSVAWIGKSDDETLSNFDKLISQGADCVICTAASNVTGRVMPIEQIAAMCKNAGAKFIVDGAQACGNIPISLDMGINIICTAGHKGLYGPSGTGVMISDGSSDIEPIMRGGTGATSGELEQTPDMPERLESGTLNTVGIAGLLSGVRFVNTVGMNKIHNYEQKLCDIFIDGIATIPETIIYRNGERFVPIVSFNFANIDPATLSSVLDSNGIALRAGLHCAPLAHKTLGTLPLGTVRFSPSVFNTQEEVVKLIDTLKKISKQGI